MKAREKLMEEVCQNWCVKIPRQNQIVGSFEGNEKMILERVREERCSRE